MPRKALRLTIRRSTISPDLLSLMPRSGGSLRFKITQNFAEGDHVVLMKEADALKLLGSNIIDEEENS